MKLYTKKGDKGKTSIIGKRLNKSSKRIDAIGDVDELSAYLGIISSMLSEDKEVIQAIQRDLYEIGADLSIVKTRGKNEYKIKQKHTDRLEYSIDKVDEKLTPITHFILAGGTEVASKFHYARAVARRAERSIVKLQEKEEVNEEIMRYINRLSDYLFVLARYYNYLDGVDDVKS